MKLLIPVCLIGSVVLCATGAQDPSQPTLRPGVSVQMPVARHAVVARDADEPTAVIVAITEEGKVYVGVTPTDPSALSSLNAATVYVKADSRVPFQKVLTVLDALRGKSVVLLAAAPANREKDKILPPYGIEVSVSR